MMNPDRPVETRMDALIRALEQGADQKVVFLSCYRMMTHNMIVAIDRCEFHDCAWVEAFLDHFASYYFAALDAYELDPLTAPAVWKVAHDAAGDSSTTALQKLLLGVDAHINYDLVFTLVDLLAKEWAGLPAGQRSLRYQDFCKVNDVIARTIDAVQDQILDPTMPVMEWVDKLLGPVDEFLISRLIADWREEVWEQAVGLMETQDGMEREHMARRVEERAMQTARALMAL